MPKRIIDGEGLWTSDKLAQVEPDEFRAEYANLLPLAMGNGSFECNPRTIWLRVYAYNRPAVTQAMVEAVLAEFERVKLLFRWEVDGKPWGYWVGIEAPGRLPPPTKSGKLGEIPPVLKLKEFCTQYPDGTSTVPNGYPEGTERVARLGSGLDRLGSGFGLGSGRDLVKNTKSLSRKTKINLVDFSEQQKLFEQLWQIWPRHDKHDSTLKKFLAVSSGCADVILERGLQQVEFWRLDGKEKQFVPMLHTWLHQKRFDTEPERFEVQPHAKSARRSLTDEEFTNAMAEADRELADRSQPRR